VAVSCSGWPAAVPARCDFVVEPGGEVLVNEDQHDDGFTQTRFYAKLLEASGIAYPELCNRLVELAMERTRAPRPLVRV